MVNVDKATKTVRAYLNTALIKKETYTSFVDFAAKAEVIFGSAVDVEGAMKGKPQQRLSCLGFDFPLSTIRRVLPSKIRFAVMKMA